MEVKESKDKGIFVKDLSTYVVKNVAEISKVMRKGQKSRQVGATQVRWRVRVQAIIDTTWQIHINHLAISNSLNTLFRVE